MQSLVSLEGYGPELRSYLLQHRWPAAMEALLTGLAVMMPHDPWEFLAEKLAYLMEEEDAEIQWDMFVDPSVRPKLPLLRRGMIDSLLDDTDQPTEKMFEDAFHHRKLKLLRWCFAGWLQFHEIEQVENAAFLSRLAQAKQHYCSKMRRKLFTTWRAYSAFRKSRVTAAYSKLACVHQQHMKKTLFNAWVEDYKEARRAKRWFNRVMAGEGEDGEGEGAWHWPEGEDPISLFPREIAVKILGLVGVQSLCRCACVCRSWKDITEDPQLWNRVDFHPISHFVTNVAILRLFHKYRPLLGHLNLRGCTHLTAESLKCIGQCQNLQDLNLSECQGLSDTAMDNIAKGCSGLLYLNLSYCFVTDSIIRILSKRCVSLHYLSLAYCTQFTSKGLHSIVGGKGCRRLVYLDLSGCSQLTPEGLHFIGKGCAIINTLLLDDLPEITDTMLLKLVSHCHTLRHVSFLGSSRLTDRSFKYLAMENRKLRSIKIENNATLTDITVRALAKACRDLQHVYLAGCSRITDQGLRALGSLRKLQVLNIADCTRVSDAGIRHIVENASGSQLRELNFTNCIKISDVTLLRMSQSCKSLTYVNFCYCEHISDTGVDLLSHMPTLTSLDLSGCNLTDQGVAGLRHNPQFRHLTLAELLDVTDDGLQKMCYTLSRLETLDLSDCENITNTGVQTVAFNCRMLRCLHLANCHQVTDDGARYLSQGCTYLTQLDMSGCSITDKALRLLRKGCTQLTRLDILWCVDVTREAVQKYQSRGVEVNYNTDRPKFLQQSLVDLPVETLLDRI